MLQSLATLLFASAAILAAGLTVLLVRADWETILDVIGVGRARSKPLPPHIRRIAVRRATMIELSPRALRRAA